ncbi:hypothetical protein SH1V18_33400 [Vallitalea longa]|uniref:Stage 0 sporulation protein A homolog n=1 Tax=Vallitalea longa TaxID=2936439 RepID=A0A9W5YE48_9FIRM|nr:response regulator [Vallitalea longa]GKX30860.1 hypothetical protein SH1V18_33400 [Vallitalea longa]
MYKILLVEDEPIFRFALKTLIEWEKHNIDMSLEAPNGKKALEIIKNNMDVDVVITDINMPVMDGLKLIEEIRKMNINPSIIVLSAYDDFNLVRQAFKYGVTDYILKREMEPEQVLELIINVIKKHDNINKNNNIINKDKDKYIKSLLNDGEKYNLKQQIATYKLKLISNNMTVCCILIDNYQQISKRYSNSINDFERSVLRAIDQVLIKLQYGEVVAISSSEYVVILSDRTNNISKINKHIEEALEAVRHVLFNGVNINISIGISETKNGYDYIPISYKQAKKNSQLRFLLGKGKNIYPKDSVYVKESNRHSIIGQERNLINALNRLDKESVNHELDKIFYSISKFKVRKINDIITSYMELFFLISQYMNDIDKDYRLPNEKVNFYEHIKSYETVEEVNNWIKSIIEEIINYLQEDKYQEISQSTKKAKQFIEKHYKEKITFKNVCEYVHLSEAYFSKIFAKDLKLTFTEYLTKKRIEKAKELLGDTDMKIYEICYCVGYANVEHFSRTFKKIVGMSPKQYKKS